MDRHFILSLIVKLFITPCLFSQNTSLKIGDKAPGIFLRDLNGQDFFLSDYCGKPRQPWKNRERHSVVISFFATWCAPCMQEMPELIALASQFPRVKFILIDLKEDKTKVRNFIRDKNITLPVLLDKFGVVAKNYGVETLPHLFVIDKSGTITFVQKGYDQYMPARLRNHLVNSK